MSARKPNARVIYEQHRSSVWFTPLKLRKLAARVLGPAPIALDPCTHKSNPLGASVAFTRADNGLARDWTWELIPFESRTVWMNPPYGKPLTAWLALFLECMQDPQARGLVLVPARPGAKWYRELCDRSQVYCELDGRVRFEVLKGARLVPAKDCARWGATLVYFGADRARVGRMLAPFGAVRFVLPSRAARVRDPLALNASQLTIAMAADACGWCGVADPHHRAACPTLEAHEHRDACTCECSSCGSVLGRTHKPSCSRARPCCPDCQHAHGVEAELDAQSRFLQSEIAKLEARGLKVDRAMVGRTHATLRVVK